MLNYVGKKAAFFVLLTFCAVPPVTAGWFDNAVEGAKQRIGTRAVNETAEGGYDAAKDALLNKDKDKDKTGAKGAKPSQGGSSFKEPERHRPAAGEAGEAIDDEHFIQKDDYFVSKKALDKSPYVYVTLCKMVTEASARSKGEAEFFKVSDGSNFWSKFYYQSTIAQDGDIKLGTPVIIFEGRRDAGVYQAPETKEEARGHAWFMAKVTDVSDMFRGYVTVSGNYKVSLRDLRIVQQKPSKPTPQEQ